MRVKNYVQNIKVPEGVNVKLEGTLLIVSKGKESVSRDFKHPKIEIKSETDKIKFNVELMTKREKTTLGLKLTAKPKSDQKPLLFRLF